MSYLSRSISLLLAVFAASLNAQETAHVHGQAILTVAVESGHIVVGLDTPTDSLWGFEHPALTTEERAKVDKVMKRLADGSSVIQIPGAARCKQTAFTLENEKEEHDDEHAAKHEHAVKDEHKDESEEHQDLVISYKFDCAAPEFITPFDVTLFKNFPAYQRLRVQWVDSTQQLEKELSSQSFTFSLDK